MRATAHGSTHRRALAICWPIVVAATVGSFGCAGARARVVATSAVFPVSMSPAVRDTDGHILMEKNLVKVGDFTLRFTSVSMLWQLIPLSRMKHDISLEVDKQVKAVNGEAVVNLSLHVRNNGWNTWNALIVGWGVFPGYAKFEVTGDIVRCR